MLVHSSSFVLRDSRLSQKSHGMSGFNNRTHRLLAPISFSIEILSQFDAREIWHLLSRFSAWLEKTLVSEELPGPGLWHEEFSPNAWQALTSSSWFILTILCSCGSRLYPNYRTCVLHYRHTFHSRGGQVSQMMEYMSLLSNCFRNMNENYQHWNQSFSHPLQS